MFSSLDKQFWLQSAERAVKTFLQTFLGAVATFGITGLRAQLVSALLIATFAAAGSLATSLGSERVGDRQSPSIVRSIAPAPKARKRPGRSRRVPMTGKSRAGAAGAA